MGLETAGCMVYDQWDPCCRKNVKLESLLDLELKRARRVLASVKKQQQTGYTCYLGLSHKPLVLIVAPGPGDLCAMKACVHASARHAFIMLTFWALVAYLAINL